MQVPQRFRCRGPPHNFSGFRVSPLSQLYVTACLLPETISYILLIRI
jgi:hypothetical protein